MIHWKNYLSQVILLGWGLTYFLLSIDYVSKQVMESFNSSYWIYQYIKILLEEILIYEQSSMNTSFLAVLPNARHHP